jgi:copper chaperone
MAGAATIELQVAGMTCGHCVKAVTAAVQALDPAAEVSVSLEAGTLRATTQRSAAEVAAAVRAEGYTVGG